MTAGTAIGTFGIIGGDARQIYLAQSIAKDGYSVCVGGFETYDSAGSLQTDTIPKTIAKSNVIILPLPATKDGKYLNAPFSSETIRLNDTFAETLRDKIVFGGLMKKICHTSLLWEDIKSYDYYSREELMVGNAFLTAEGALGLAINALPGAINGSDCLVTGFGRIGKALCIYLRALGANVDCAARKSSDLMYIKALGCGAVQYKNIQKRYDMIFNTVPVTVLGASQLSKQSRDTVIFELASMPGGVDLEAAGRLGIQIINGQSIPGRVSPKTSGEYIKEAIYNMMEE